MENKASQPSDTVIEVETQGHELISIPLASICSTSTESTPSQLLPHKVTATNSLEVGAGLALWTKRIENLDSELSYYEDSLSEVWG